MFELKSESHVPANMIAICSFRLCPPDKVFAFLSSFFCRSTPLASSVTTSSLIRDRHFKSLKIRMCSLTVRSGLVRISMLTTIGRLDTPDYVVLWCISKSTSLVDLNDARRYFLVTRNAIQGCTLAAAVWSKQAKDLTGVCLEVDALDGMYIGTALEDPGKDAGAVTSTSSAI